MSLVPAKETLVIYQGATFYHRIIYKVAGQIQDLTGYSASLPIKDKAGGNVLLTLNTSNGGITLGGSSGTIDLLIDSTATNAITWNTAVYELRLTDGAARTDVIMNGNFKVVKF